MAWEGRTKEHTTEAREAARKRTQTDNAITTVNPKASGGRALMLSDPTTHLATVAAGFAALYAAHQVADHWIQTQHQANTKGRAGWRGRIACAAHVATYTASAVGALAVLALVTGWPLDWPHAAAGLGVSAVSHYIADRRTPIRRIADWLGKDAEWLERGGGMYALDQSWHVGWLFVAALAVAA